MGTPEEEQELEIEALQSIFEEGKELEIVSPTEVLLKLLPFPAGEKENHVGVNLRIKYTETYPETAPEWDLENIKLPDDEVGELRSKIEEAIETSMGMAMVYSIAEAVQDY